MKKILSIILTLLVFFSAITTVFALETTEIDSPKTIPTEAVISTEMSSTETTSITHTTQVQPSTEVIYGLNANYNLIHVNSSNTQKTCIWMSYYTVLSPEEGYEITDVLVTTGDKKVDVKKNNDGTYIVDINWVYGNIFVTAFAQPKQADTTKPSSTVKVPKISAKNALLKAGLSTTIRVTNGSVESWNTSNKNVAVVKNGKVTALTKGKAVITAKLNTGETLSCPVTVATNPKLSKTSLNVKKGGTAKVKILGKAISINNEYANTKYAKVTSKRSASTLTVKGVKKGTTMLKIKVNGVRTLNLRVKVK